MIRRRLPTPTPSPAAPPDGAAEPRFLELVTADPARGEPAAHLDAVARLAEAEDTLRAISAGEVDAFVVPDGGAGRRVFTLSTADRPYRMFVENMRDGAATVSPQGVVLYANRRLAELIGIPRDDIVGSTLERFLVDGAPIAWVELNGRDDSGASLETELVDGAGRLVPVLLRSSPLEVDSDELVCLTFTDLTQQRAHEAEIARLSGIQADRLLDLQHAQTALTIQATHDALTGLPNRALVVDRIDQALALATTSSSCTAVLYVDLDRFKQVNDSQGHAAGDDLLRRVAGVLVAALRPGDTVARVGGDEFAILAPKVRSQRHAVEIGTRLVDELRRAAVGPGTERGSASVGIATSIGGRGSAEVLLNEADTAMYRAKAQGGSRARVFDAELGLQVQQWTDAQRILTAALDERRVVPFFQPVVDLADGTIAGFEALARIDQFGTILPPAAFISVAEDSGLVVGLGQQMLERSCVEAQAWAAIAATSAPRTVAVNLSARQFGSGDLVATVRGALSASGLHPTRLHLEITETAIMDLRPEVLKQLRTITDLGVEVGLDDFGTGYASLTHLRRLPLTFVKIDQSFVAGLEENREDERIVAAVADLAGNLGLRSIAEGVETKPQLDRLRELGCDQVQGYLLARPMPGDEVAAALAQADTT